MILVRCSQDLVAASKERSEEQRRQRQQALESHVAQPSLYTVVEQLYTTSVAMLASGKCHVCLKRLIPADPEKLCKVPTHMQVRTLVRIRTGGYSQRVHFL